MSIRQQAVRCPTIGLRYEFQSERSSGERATSKRRMHQKGTGASRAAWSTGRARGSDTVGGSRFDRPLSRRGMHWLQAKPYHSFETNNVFHRRVSQKSDRTGRGCGHFHYETSSYSTRQALVNRAVTNGHRRAPIETFHVDRAWLMHPMR